MKDSTDKGTGDMFGEKRGRGRPKTGTAKTGAERQAAYRTRQQAEYLTVRLPKGLAQTKAVRNGTPSIELTPLQAGELLKAIRAAERTALRGQAPEPEAVHQAVGLACGRGRCPPRQGSLSNDF